jgi:zinc protease
LKGGTADIRVPPVHRHRLDNGLTLLVQPDHTSPVVTTMTCYRVGSRVETPGRTGISHFLEHMMFKGTGRFGPGEIDRITALHGGSNNAFTTQDYTAYFFSFASDRWVCALEIEADRMSNNRFDPRQFELERQVILEESRMEQDHPWGALRRSVELKAFERHPYRYPIIGLGRDIQALTVEQMVEHYRRYYVPENAVLAVAGDTDPEVTLRTVEQLFRQTASGFPPPLLPPQEPAESGRVKIKVRRRSRVPRMLVALPAPSIHQSDHDAFQILDRVLSEGRLSRLYRKFVEETQLASLVHTELGDTFDPYLLLIRLELREDADLQQTEELLCHELLQLCTSPLTRKELTRAKNQCINQFLFELETTFGQCMQLASMEALQRPGYWDDYVARISRLTAEEVMAAAARHWSGRRWTVGVVEIG